MTLAIPWNDNRIGKILQLLFAVRLFEPKTKSVAGEAANETAARLMNQYGDSILRYAYSYLHNMSDAEEILQDTLLAYLVNKPAFANEAHAKAWLFRVAGNLSKNRIRYNGYRNHDELMEELIAEEKEDLRFVWEAVSQLPENYREVIHLFYQEGFTTAEIGAILGRREVTVRSDLSRARKKLKEILKEAYDFE